MTSSILVLSPQGSPIILQSLGCRSLPRDHHHIIGESATEELTAGSAWLGSGSKFWASGVTRCVNLVTSHRLTRCAKHWENAGHARRREGARQIPVAREAQRADAGAPRHADPKP